MFHHPPPSNAAPEATPRTFASLPNAFNSNYSNYFKGKSIPGKLLQLKQDSSKKGKIPKILSGPLPACMVRPSVQDDVVVL